MTDQLFEYNALKFLDPRIELFNITDQTQDCAV